MHAACATNICLPACMLSCLRLEGSGDCFLPSAVLLPLQVHAKRLELLHRAVLMETAVCHAYVCRRIPRTWGGGNGPCRSGSGSLRHLQTPQHDTKPTLSASLLYSTCLTGSGKQSRCSKLQHTMTCCYRMLTPTFHACATCGPSDTAEVSATAGEPVTLTTTCISFPNTQPLLHTMDTTYALYIPRECTSAEALVCSAGIRQQQECEDCGRHAYLCWGTVCRCVGPPGAL